MNNYENDNFSILCLQLPSINAWTNKLKEYLSNKSKEAMNLYIVSKDWIDKFEEKGFNTKFDCSQLIDIFKKSKTIYRFPKIFVLDKDYGQENKFIIEGKFYNQMLLIDMSKYTKFKVYSFFYLSHKIRLNQGYLRIKQMDKEQDIIKDLIDIGPYYLSCKYKKSDINSQYFDIVLYESEKPKETNKNLIVNIVNKKDNHPNLDNMNNYKDKNQINNKKDILKGNLSPQKDLINENKIISEEIQSEQKLILPKKNSLKKIFPSVQILKNQKIIDKFTLEMFFPTKAIQSLSTPGIIGLIDIGATSYMNAVLQCFSNIGRLRAYLLNNEIYKNLEKEKDMTKKLSFALAEVLKNLWKKIDQRFYSPENFKKVISEMNPLFKGIAANDPKDLILFLLETMHKEMNNPRNEVIIDKIPNDTNLNEVYNNFVNYYNNKNKSIMSDEFCGFINNSTTCGYCNTKIHNVQAINILFFPLEEVKKFKNYKHNNVTILDCFDYYEKIDIYPSFHCNYCKRNSQEYNGNKIIYSPRTLIINLNRGKGLEFNVNIIFEEYLNLRKFVLSEDSPYYYELIGVISYFDSNDEGGHFIAYCKNSNNCEWYRYNDKIVSKCNFNDVEINGLHYTLFYSFIET